VGVFKFMFGLHRNLCLDCVQVYVWIACKFMFGLREINVWIACKFMNGLLASLYLDCVKFMFGNKFRSVIILIF
jgi:hypothetical protein